MAFREGEADRWVVLNGSRCTIGRSKQCTLCIPDPTVSREHAIISIRNGGFLHIEDCGSTNGVFVNGEQVASSVIRAGDFITVGVYTIVVRVIESDEESAGSTESTHPPETLVQKADSSHRLRDAFEIKHSAEHYRALYQVSLLMGERADIRTLVRQALAVILKALPAKRAAVIARFVGNKDNNLSELVCLDPENPSPPISEALIEFAMRRSSGVLMSDFGHDRRTTADINELTGARGPFICVPLGGSKKQFGILYVDGCLEGYPFTKQELQFLTASGHVLAMSIENKDLVDRVVRQERMAALGHGIAGISHDVRNVLTGIKVGVDMISSEDNGSKPVVSDRAVRLIRRSTDQVEAYLSELLDYVRRNHIVRKPTYVNGLIRDALDLVQPRANQHGVQLTFSGGGYEPANIDGTQMARVINNLLRNGVDACATNQGAVTVAVWSRSTTLYIQIADTGAGISKQDIDRLSEPFFTKKGSAGTGLGLSISYRIVEQHGGNIHVDSELGRGTTFTIVLPDSLDAHIDFIPPQQSYAEEGCAYKKCPYCGHTWLSQDELLRDPACALAGYRAHFENLPSGLLLFNHVCGTTLAFPAQDFLHLYNGPVHSEALTGQPECPGHCLRQDCLENCANECACAHIRSLLQTLLRWPKNAEPDQHG
ncbi:MAG: hypothetical protein AMXMBFR84_28280 [Candidatus Hydrogenedentota bacterium]